MKKKTLLLSILSIVMCLSLAVGGTFALFTSESKVNVAVTSGTVNVVASITETEYSYDERLTGASDCTYEINEQGGLDIEKMLPGDTITATVSIDNSSDVAIQYRVNTTVSGDLAEYLEIEKATKVWTKVNAGADIENETVVITLPYEVEDVDAQGVSASVLITVEAVQANAPVANVGSDGVTTTDTELKDAQGNAAVVPEGAKMAEGKKTLTLKVEEGDKTVANFVASYDTTNSLAYDITIPEIAKDNDEEIILTIATGKTGLTNVTMFHDGYLMNEVASADAVANHNDFYYNSEDGVITFATKSFSNFTVAVDVQLNVDNFTYVSTADELLAALNANDGKEIIFTNDITVSETGSNGYGKTSINVDGDIVNGYGHKLIGASAWGTWDSVIGMTAGTVKNLTVSNSMRGIFMPGAKGDVVIENVIFENVIYTFNSDAGSKDYSVTIKDTALNGWTSFSDVHKSVTFENCTFAKGNGYEFCRPYNNTTFNNCTFAEGFEFDTSKSSEIIFNGCYYGETLITADNAETLATGDNVLFYNGLGNAQFN